MVLSGCPVQDARCPPAEISGGRRHLCGLSLPAQKLQRFSRLMALGGSWQCPLFDSTLHYRFSQIWLSIRLSSHTARGISALAAHTLILRVIVGRISELGVHSGGQYRTPKQHAVRGFDLVLQSINAVSAILTTPGTAHSYLFNVHHFPNAAF